MDINHYKKYEPIFGTWTITREIGEGNYGNVFEIGRTDFGETFRAALKIISIPPTEKSLQDFMRSEGITQNAAMDYYRGMVEDFTKEFALMAKLKGNSNIVSYEDHQVIEHKDSFGWDILIRMELLTPLFDHIEHNPMSEKDVIRLGIDICQALELCERQSIIHRDIKPENIFVSENGSYKLGDFGVARIVGKTTGASTHVGTADYMAPEVMLGGRYDHRVDIYSLGMVLYRLLNVNRLPFLPPYPAPITYREKQGAKEMIMQGTPFGKPLNSSDETFAVILKACAFDPEQRYSSPAEMKKDLERIINLGASERVIPIIPGEEDWNTPTELLSEKITLKDADGTVKVSEPVDIHPSYREASPQTDGRNASDKIEDNKAKKTGRWIIPVIAGIAAFLTIVVIVGIAMINSLQKKDQDDGLSAAIEEELSSDEGTEEQSEEVSEEPSEEGGTEEYDIGIAYYDNQDYENAVEWLTKASELGNSYADLKLGYIYYYGNGVEEDRAKSFDWYLKAAEKGNAGGQFHIGNAYYYGEGVATDYKQAAKWLLKAAEQDDARAEDMLGYMYLYGEGVDQDPEKALEMYTKAASHDGGGSYVNDAYYSLGYMYENGLGTERNIDEAIKWYQKAADQMIRDADQKVAELSKYR